MQSLMPRAAFFQVRQQRLWGLRVNAPTSAPLPMGLQNWRSDRKKPRAKVATSGLRDMDERRTMSRHWMASCGKFWPPPSLR